MTTLARLFPQGARIEEPTLTFDDHHTVRRLTEMFGEPGGDIDMTRPRASTLHLSQLVEEAVQNAAPMVVPAAPVSAKRRHRRRFDGLAVTAASLAVVAVAAAGIVGGIQMANASPAASALHSLRSDEASILNSYQSLAAGSGRLGTAIEQSKADALLLRSNLQTTSTAPDPTVSDTVSPGLPIVDEAALTATLAAVDTYVTGLDAVAAPELPEAYERGDVNEDSLAEVGAAINAAQQQLSEISAAALELREVRAQVDELKPPLQQALATYATTFPSRAKSLLEDNPDAEPALRDAVATAAVGVVSSGAFGAEGIGALTAYRNAVIAMVDDQVRTEGDRREAEEEERQENQPQPQPTDPLPIDPLPTDPQPTPQPTEPPPTEPESPPVIVPPVGGNP